MSRKPYPSDVSDEEWSLVVRYLVLMDEEAPQREYPLREMFNALRYVVRSGCPWRMLPHDLPPWEAVYQQVQRWMNAQVFEAIVDDLRRLIRLAEGRDEEPSAAIIDGRTLQSTPESGHRAGYDGHKKKRGSKVHMVVDTLGDLLTLRVTAANVQERAQVADLAEEIQAITGDHVKLLYADQGYTGDAAAEAAADQGMDLVVAKLHEAKKGFVLLPRRWVVEIVFTQMTKADLFAFGASGNDIADLHDSVRDDHPVNQQQHQLALLFKGGVGQTLLDPVTKGINRARHASEFLLVLGFARQLLFLMSQRLLLLGQLPPPPLVLVKGQDCVQVGIG
jgi:transposase